MNRCPQVWIVITCLALAACRDGGQTPAVSVGASSGAAGSASSAGGATGSANAAEESVAAGTIAGGADETAGGDAPGTTAGGTTAGGTTAGGASSAGTGGASSMSDGDTAGQSGVAGSVGAADSGAQPSTRPARVLLYTLGSSGVIRDIPEQIASYKQTLMDWGFESDESVDAAMFTDDNLAEYAAVAMINTCFSPFGNNRDGTNESMALQRFLQQGGGLFGTHCANVTFTSAATMPLYNQLLGGWAHNGQNSSDNGSLDCTRTADHPASTNLPATFPYVGNVDVADVTQDATVLVECTYGNTTTPVSWVRTETGGGRVFYTSFAKVDADLRDATLGTNHILAGLGWVLGRQ